MRRQRWLFVVSELAGVTRYTGGVGVRYSRLLPHIASQEVAVTVCVVMDTHSEGLNEDSANELLGVEVRVIEASCRKIRVPKVIARCIAVRRFVKENGPFDRLVAPEWQGLLALVPAWSVVVTNLVTGTALLDRLNLNAPTSISSRLRRVPQRVVERLQIQRSSHLIAISSAIMSETRRFYRIRAKQSFNIIPNSIDADYVASSRVIASPRDFPEGRVVLFAGRSEHRKGVDLLLRAFTHVARERLDVTLVLVGSDPSGRWEKSGDLRDFVMRTGLERRILYLGRAAPRSVYSAMNSALVCVFPSRWEAFGNVALEAHAAGTAVVVTSGSGFDDFCSHGENALVVEANDVHGLSSAIIELLDDESLRRKLEGEAKVRLPAYGLEHIAERYRASILSGKN